MFSEKLIKFLLLGFIVTVVSLAAYMAYQKRLDDAFIGPRLPDSIEEKMRINGEL